MRHSISNGDAHRSNAGAGAGAGAQPPPTSLTTSPLNSSSSADKKSVDIDALCRRRDPQLHRATREGGIAEMTSLLKQGANPEAFDSRGDRALHAACRKTIYTTNLTAVECLLEAGANINALNLFDQTALHVAVESSNLYVVTALLTNGAKTDTFDIYGQTPLHIACKHGRSATVATLIESNVDINMQTKKEGETALHIAIRKGDLAVIKVLVAGGADTTIRDHLRESVFDALALSRVDLGRRKYITAILETARPAPKPAVMVADATLLALNGLTKPGGRQTTAMAAPANVDQAVPKHRQWLNFNKK
jgi:hypothetical protein